MREKVIALWVSFQLIYLAWAWGGLHRSWLLPAVLVSLVFLCIILASSFRTRVGSELKGTPFWRDFFFYSGALFLTYLAIQWWNAGRILFFDVGLKEWRYSPPRHMDWPTAISKKEAAEMVYWFFPAWVLGLAVRSPLVGTQALMRALRTLVYGAGLLALIGVIQFVTHAKARLWIRPTAEFFASFGYTNHAAAYFVLIGALAAGLLYREIFSARSEGVNARIVRSVVPGSGRNGGSAHPVMKTHPFRTAALAASLLLCLVGANLSLSRAGIILAWALAGFIAVYGLIRGGRTLNRAGQINLFAATVAVLFVFYFAVAGFGENGILQQFKVVRASCHPLFPILDKINLDLSEVRPVYADAAFRMWKDHPGLGVGGWGFRHLLAFYVPIQKWQAYVRNPGGANVHCDGLQFLAEFGLVGAGLMSMALLSLIVSLFQNTSKWNSVWIMAVIGLSLVVIFSMIDLPFRCPAILCTWVVVIAALPKIARRQSQRMSTTRHWNCGINQKQQTLDTTHNPI